MKHYTDDEIAKIERGLERFMVVLLVIAVAAVGVLAIVMGAGHG